MTSKKYKMYYDYSKRTRGGFTDAMLLSGMTIVKVHIVSAGCIFTDHLPFNSL